MLNRTQKKFRKEMDQIAKESSKQAEVFSYVENKHIQGSYSSLFRKKRSVGRTVSRLITGLLLIMLALGVYSYVQQSKEGQSQLTLLGTNQSSAISKNGQAMLEAMKLEIQVAEHINEVVALYNSMQQTDATLEMLANLDRIQTDLANVLGAVSFKLNSEEYPQFGYVFLETLAQLAHKSLAITSGASSIARYRMEKIDISVVDKLFISDLNDSKQLVDKLTVIFKTISDTKGYPYTTRPDGSIESFTIK